MPKEIQGSVTGGGGTTPATYMFISGVQNCIQKDLTGDCAPPQKPASCSPQAYVQLRQKLTRLCPTDVGIGNAISVTRLGNLLDFGQLFKAFGNN